MVRQSQVAVLCLECNAHTLPCSTLHAVHVCAAFLIHTWRTMMSPGTLVRLLTSTNAA